MMICFAGILQNTCCNKINENKTIKNRVVIVGSFTQLRALIDIVSHLCVLLQTHK